MSKKAIVAIASILIATQTNPAIIAAVMIAAVALSPSEDR